MITIPSEFLQSLINNQRATDARVRVTETEITTLYDQMKLGVKNKFEQTRAR